MFRADWNGEHMSVTGIAGKTADGTLAQTGAAGGTDLRGVTVSCKMHEMVKPSVYVYNMVEHAKAGLGTSGTTTTGGKNSNLWIAGVKAKFTSGGLTASGEIAVNRGEDRSLAQNTSYKGYAWQAKVAYKAEVSNVGAITPWGEFGVGTGDNNGTWGGNRNFQSVNTDYRPGGIYGRFDKNATLKTFNNTGTPAGNFGTASDGLSNRVIWGIGAKITPSAWNKLTAGVAFYRYAFDRLPEIEGAIPQRISRNIGSEVDVTAEWKHSENVSLKATAGSFKPGAAIADIKGANAIMNPAVMLAGDVVVKF
jgi:hypothetical protein